SWFRLGDRDLATHLLRTRWLREGLPLSAVTRRLARAYGLRARPPPMGDGRVRPFVHTGPGRLPFPAGPGPPPARGRRRAAGAARGGGGAARARGARRDPRRGRDRDRAVEPARLCRADPRRARRAPGARAPAGAGGGDLAARRRAAAEGAASPHAPRPRARGL